MCIFGGSTPKYTPPAVPAASPTPASQGVQNARADEKRRQRAAAGRSSTIKTTSDLLGTANTTSNSAGNLLGA